MIECCVLKGKTTTEEQFDRFLNSYFIALQSRYHSIYADGYSSDVFTTFMVNTDNSEKLVDTYVERFQIERYSNEPCNSMFQTLRRNDDPGELRNEFLARLSMNYDDRFAEAHSLVFMFFDGDDTISENYFNFNESLVLGRGFALMNPVAVYGDSESDHYPLKWCQSSLNSDIYQCVLTDRIGGQCWGKVWEWKICRESKFGRGLFEDVRFWYDVTRTHRNPLLLWNSVYYWYRNNPSALTRLTATEAQIRDGLDNLKYAKDVALADYDYSDKRVWKRYTTGILVLVRNAGGSDDPVSLRQYIASYVDYGAFKPKILRMLEPKFFDKLLEEFPEYPEWEKELDSFNGMPT